MGFTLHSLCFKPLVKRAIENYPKLQKLILVRSFRDHERSMQTTLQIDAFLYFIASIIVPYSLFRDEKMIVHYDTGFLAAFLTTDILQ